MAKAKAQASISFTKKPETADLIGKITEIVFLFFILFYCYKFR